MTQAEKERSAPGCAAEVRIDTRKRYQTVRDFGESICWWAPVLGGTQAGSRALRLLHTKEGLDLNVLRFNVGGSVREDRSDAPYPEDSLPRRAPLSPLKEDGTYDVNRDSGLLAMLREAVSMGTIQDFTLFMNSPPSSMTKNGMTCSEEPEASGGFVSNLAPEAFPAYARYVADVTALYLDEGIPVKYVSPINEPQWQWDRNNRQEGCHYEPEEMMAFFREVIAVFRERAVLDPRFSKVKISLPETAQWYWPKPYVFGAYEEMCRDPELASYADHFSAHSYGTNADHKREFAAHVKALGRPFPLHQTEWGPLHADASHPMEFALEMANCMYEDLTILDVPHWTWWTGLAGFSYPSGLIDADADGSEMVLSKRYYVMMHHSRFIRGYTRVAAGISGDLGEAEGGRGAAGSGQSTIAEKKWEPVAVSAYLSPDGEDLAAVFINNTQEEKTVRIVLSPEEQREIPALCQTGEVYVTDALRDCVPFGKIRAGECLTLPPLSVATVSLGGRRL